MDTDDVPDPIRLMRTAKGRRPHYFADPATDRLLAILVSLVGEVAVLRERLDTVERLAEHAGVLTRHAIEEFQPSAEERAARDARRAAYLQRVFRILQATVEEQSGDRAARPLEEVIADFAAGRF
jgi:hypothetical protein